MVLLCVSQYILNGFWLASIVAIIQLLTRDHRFWAICFCIDCKIFSAYQIRHVIVEKRESGSRSEQKIGITILHNFNTLSLLEIAYRRKKRNTQILCKRESIIRKRARHQNAFCHAVTSCNAAKFYWKKAQHQAIELLVSCLG